MNEVITQSWENCLKKGKIKEQIFKEDFLDYLNIGYVDVTDDSEYRKKDIDLLPYLLKSVDVKSYRDKKHIPIEEMSAVETGKKGWVYESEADYFVFVSIKTRTMLILRNDNQFQNWWIKNRNRFELITQKTRKFNGDNWHSQHRNVPLKELNIMWVRKNNQYKE